MVDKQGEGARGQPATSAWSVPEGRRTDEWSQCVVRIAEHRDRAAFAKFFSHFAPLIKAFALSGTDQAEVAGCPRAPSPCADHSSEPASMKTCNF